MKIQSFEKVLLLIEERDELISTNESIQRDNWLGVTFNGKYQRNEVLDIVRPVVMNYLVAKRQAIDEELKILGVDI